MIRLTRLQRLDIETIAVVVALIAAASTATAFYVGLRGKVTALEKQLQRLEKHSLLVFYDKWIATKGTAAFFDDTLKSREENG
jgi:hypothetical protein